MDERPTDQPRREPGFQLNPPTLVCLFYLATWFTGFSALVGMILAYAFRRSEDEARWEETHYTFHIRTFWMGFAGLAVVAATFFAVVIFADVPSEAESPAFIAAFAVAGGAGLLLAVRLVVRCAFALINAQRSLPMPRPRTYWV